MRSGLFIAVVAACVPASAALATPTLFQVIDFQSGSNQGWVNGGAAPDPVNMDDGGPLGQGDSYLRVTANGGGGPLSRLVVLNTNQRWTGDFASAGVTTVGMDLKNFGTEPLSMRVAFRETGGTWYASTTPFTLAADGAWHPAAFDLRNAGIVPSTGTTPVATGLTRVGEFRILHNESIDYKGAAVSSAFGVDNIAALPEPAGAAAAAALLPLLARRRRGR